MALELKSVGLAEMSPAREKAGYTHLMLLSEFNLNALWNMKWKTMFKEELYLSGQHESGSRS